MPWDPAKYDDPKIDVNFNDDNNEMVAVEPYIDPEYEQGLNSNQEAYFMELLQQKVYSISTECMNEFEKVSNMVCAYETPCSTL
jgi:hypothetical protein